MRLFVFHFLLVIVATFVFGLNGCGDAEVTLLSGKGESCARTADCQPPLRCIGKVCVDDPNDPTDDVIEGGDSGLNEDLLSQDGMLDPDTADVADRADVHKDGSFPDLFDAEISGDVDSLVDVFPDSFVDVGSTDGSGVDDMDSTEVTPESQCLSTAGNCWIDGTCIASGHKMMQSGCQVCNGLKDQHGWTNLAVATACDDGKLCTYGDQCDATGKCVGISIVCNNSDTTTCGQKRICNGTDTCVSSYPDVSTTCNDGNQCTFADHCNGAGACVGTTIVCSDDDSTLCSRKRTCNGTSVCTAWYPDETTQCSDGEDCTYSDRCNGSGGCAGTRIICTSDVGPCGVVRTCNGTSTCNASTPGATVSCDDSDPCTYSDQCNGNGGCAGTPISCEDDVCVTRVCNGTESCALSEYTEIGIGCDDGDSCTIDDVCDGNGLCLGLAYSCNGHGSCDGQGGCVCHSGYSGATCSVCADGAAGTYPHCFLPTASYCRTALCYAISPTGETTCSNASAILNSCPGAAGGATCGTTSFCGQDAQYPDNPRTYTCFTESGVTTPCADLGNAVANETVLDSLTGLVWQRTFIVSASYASAVSYCESLDYAGQTDWRLPSIIELSGIVNIGTNSPSVDLKAFPSGNISLWSSTLYAPASNSAWTVKFEAGSVETLSVVNAVGARCVRGSSGAPESDAVVPSQFVPVGTPEGPVNLDITTGLYWQDAYVYKTWQAALAYCEGLAHGGYNDWRLPNRNEFLSVVDYSMSQPASRLPHLVDAVQYWVSDTLVYDRDSGWVVYSGNGAVGTLAKTSSRYVMCVR